MDEEFDLSDIMAEEVEESQTDSTGRLAQVSSPALHVTVLGARTTALMCVFCVFFVCACARASSRLPGKQH